MKKALLRLLVLFRKRSRSRAFVFRLPDEEEMLKRLQSVSQVPNYETRFYPLLLKKAGDDLSPVELAKVFKDAVADYSILYEYSEGKSKKVPVGITPEISVLWLKKLIPDFIRKLTHDAGEEVSEKVLYYYENPSMHIVSSAEKDGQETPAYGTLTGT